MRPFVLLHEIDLPVYLINFIDSIYVKRRIWWAICTINDV